MAETANPRPIALSYLHRIAKDDPRAKFTTVRKSDLRALIQAVEAAETLAPLLPSLHRDALDRYLARFDFAPSP